MTATQEVPAGGSEIGKARRRKEDQRLITGRTRWTDNITLPGMLHAVYVKCPVFGGTVAGANLDEVRALLRDHVIVEVVENRDRYVILGRVAGRARSASRGRISATRT